MSDLKGLLWFAAFMVWAYVLGDYFAGAVQFKDWRWPWR